MKTKTKPQKIAAMTNDTEFTRLKFTRKKMYQAVSQYVERDTKYHIILFSKSMRTQ